MRSTQSISRCCSLLIAVCLLLSLSACGNSVDRQDKTIFSMDTVIFLTAYGDQAEAGLRAATDTINELNALLSPETEGSAVFRLNQGEIVQDTDITALLEICRTVYAASDGAFDPTVYPLAKAWGFIGADYRVPSAEEIDALLQKVNFSHVTDSNAGIQLPEGMTLGFGAVAKGYAAQKATAAMVKAGVESAILSLGGNIQTLGTKPNKSAWEIAVQDPLSTDTRLGTLALKGSHSVVTSGGYQRCFEAAEHSYHHILDPKTGYPSDSGLLSVTVVCNDGALADALSTALFVLGENAAIALYRQFGSFELLLVTEDERIVVTPGLQNCFSQAKDSTYRLDCISPTPNL